MAISGTRAASLAVAMAALAPLSAFAAAAPISGSWARVTIYIASASGAFCPSSLTGAVGKSTVGQLYFAGGGKTGSLLYFYAPGTTTSSVDIYSATLPALASSDGGQTSGNINITDLKAGLSLGGTAQATLTYGLPSAYFLTLDAAVTGCNLDLNLTGEQTGT